MTEAPTRLRQVAAATTLYLGWALLAQSCHGGGAPPGSAYTPAVGQARPGVAPRRARSAARVAVAETGGAVQIFDRKYHGKGKITQGLALALGAWYDAHGRLYVANLNPDSQNADVVEYEKGATTPHFSYPAPTGSVAWDAATDSAGNVYMVVGSAGGNEPSGVLEFARDTSVPKAVCFGTDGNLFGVAVDRAGDVFVSQQSPRAEPSQILEFAGGIGGCHATVLGAQLPREGAGALVIDRENTIVAADQRTGAVDFISPPYTSIAKHVGGFEDPSDVALNADESLLFVADIIAGTVSVLTYPDGTLVRMLGQSDGVTGASGVATFP